MSDEKPPSSGATRPPGGRRPATIDLIATEIQSWPVTQASAPPAEPATENVPAEPATEDAPPTAPAEVLAQPQPEPEPHPADAHVEPAPAPPPDAPPDEPIEPKAAAAPAEPSHEMPPPPAPPPRTRTPWLALVGAGVAGGAVALAVVAVASLLQGDARPLDARLAGVEQRLRDLAARPVPAAGDGAALDEIKSRLGKLETAPAAPRPGATDPAVANRIAVIEGEAKALTESVGILNRRSDATAAALAELAQKAARTGAPTIERSDLEALANRIAAVERNEKSAEAGDRSARLALAAAMLKAAVERGDPFAAELNAAKSLGADAKLLTALEPFAAAGVPTAAALSRELAGLAPALLAASGAAPGEGGILEKLKLNAEKLVRIRPVEEIAGSDPAAVVARIEVRAAQADVAGALAELAKLPEAARAPAAAWIKTAQARGAAVDQARRIAADALAGLGK